MTYDPSTLSRLTWRHGAERTARIMLGRDAETEADLIAWRQIGGAVYMSRSLELARRLVANGENRKDAAEAAGISRMSLAKSIDRRPL